ncbi:hypothetical protein A4G99_07055 [Haladaptatus sp. R4]|uniref:hypothetical protein n=1 Tax=Haladaptatus sp. R4 TaxID=1679489 RepID=UPI0007B49BF2|nr:hypothetical protein [Haladaptatus sp. R4]KZN24194.1 hypothetical protein A4G99_07055 [Haladaptatus sp. R4]
MKGQSVGDVTIPLTLYNQLFAESQHDGINEIKEKYPDRMGKGDVKLWVLQACVEKAVREGRVDGLDEDDDVFVTIAGGIKRFDDSERDSSGRFQ